MTFLFNTVSNSMMGAMQDTDGRLLLIGHDVGDVGCGMMMEVELMKSVVWKGESREQRESSYIWELFEIEMKVV